MPISQFFAYAKTGKLLVGGSAPTPPLIAQQIVRLRVRRTLMANKGKIQKNVI